MSNGTSAAAVEQIPLFADVFRCGDEFRIVPKKPAYEVTATEAAKILGMSRGHFWFILNLKPEGKLIRWRRLSQSPTSRRLIEVSSLEAYRQATKQYCAEN